MSLSGQLAPHPNQFAIVALGSNLGSREEILLEVMDRLGRFASGPMLKSSLYETAPVDCPEGSPLFVNAVVAFVPLDTISPELLLSELQKLERDFGRTQKKIINEARPLDLDLIAFQEETRKGPDLILPHPRAHLRQFVLEPLSQIVPCLILPGQKSSVAELLVNLRKSAN